MKATFFITTVSALLMPCTALFGSQEDIQKFFEAGNSGKYAIMHDTIKKSLITPQEIISTRDNDDNSIISAAIKAYPQAAKQYGEQKATQALFEMLTLMLSKMSKDQAVKLLNNQNKAGMTPLFLAAQLGVPLKIIDLLHSKGAMAATKENKKASTYAKDAYTKRILQQWENLEGDWELIPAGERIK